MNRYLLTAIIFSMTAANLAFAQPALYPQSAYYSEPQYCTEYYPATTPVKKSTSYNYWNIGVGPLALIPNIGVGTRHVTGNWGYDLSLNVGSSYYFSSAQIIASALYIPNPNVENHLYCGLGVSGGVATNKHFNQAKFFLTPDVVIGKMLTNTPCSKTFVEMHVEGPMWGAGKHLSFRNKDRLDFPLVCVKYGMNF